MSALAALLLLLSGGPWYAATTTATSTGVYTCTVTTTTAATSTITISAATVVSGSMFPCQLSEITYGLRDQKFCWQTKKGMLCADQPKLPIPKELQ